MKTILSLAGLFLFSITSQAQQPQVQNAATNKMGCMDPDTRLLADEVRQHYAAQGFAVVRNAMLTMSSNQPFPVVIELAEKEKYQIAFIANKDANLLTTEILGPDKRRLFHQTNRTRKTGSRVIAFPFTAPRTDAYLFILQQNLRRDETCGGFLMFRDTLKTRTAPVASF